MHNNISVLVLLSLALFACFKTVVQAEVEDAFSTTGEAQNMQDFDDKSGNQDDMDISDESGGNNKFDEDGAAVCWWADNSSCESCCLDAKFVNHYWNDMNGCTCDVLYENKAEQSGDGGNN